MYMSVLVKQSLMCGILSIGIAVGCGAAPHFARAQETSTDGTVSSTQEQRAIPPLRKMREEAAQVREVRQDIRQDTRADLQGMRDVRQQQRQDFSEQARTMREDTVGKLKNATSSADRKTIRENARVEREAFRTVRVEARAEFRSELGKRLATHKATIVRTLTTAIDRMNDILAKLESRIAKIAEQGGDVSAATTAFASAQQAVEAAAAAIESADAAIVATIDSDADLATKRKEVQAATQKARQAIRDAQRAIAEVLATLRTAVPTGSTQN